MFICITLKDLTFVNTFIKTEKIFALNLAANDSHIYMFMITLNYYLLGNVLNACRGCKGLNAKDVISVIGFVMRQSIGYNGLFPTNSF